MVPSLQLLVAGTPPLAAAAAAAAKPILKHHNCVPRRPVGMSTQSAWSPPVILRATVPLSASLAILLWSTPADAGFLSGLSGIESVPGPQLPQIDFLSRFNEENQKKYAENDARFKESPILKELLEKSKLNKEKNRQETLDKYCVRGAEWGVGDCSTAGMSPEDRDKFIAMLKEKTGTK
ncbi:hypothetical protein MLD38_004333 [Melastoma candidum]|uniref:Uncharacterized protein n=1 Tax=Melastoma candidum TaxID=119954 RepID=A0ACB9S4V2_9MYRT|nr:hypothetical protein MLD38_004333 [Melastoma candidum]